MDTELELVVAESAIRRIVNRYARGVDRRDFDLVRSCYHPDAVEDRGPGRYCGDVEGFVEWLREQLSGYASSSHHIGTQNMEIDGDVAHVESYCLALHRTAATGDAPAMDRVIPCRYMDRFERREGRWLIAARTNVYDPGREDAVGIDLPALGIAGRPGPDDPSYGLGLGTP